MELPSKLSRAEYESELEHILVSRSRLLEACKTAAEWLSRSTRIDDQEQAQDLREVIEYSEGAK